MNRKDWKTDDSSWVKAQGKKWLHFEKRLRRKYDDENPEELAELLQNIKLGYNFMTGDVIELPKRGVMELGYNSFEWILMHPNPNEENITLIFEDFVAKGFGERLPYAHKGMDISSFCQDLVAKKVVNESVVEAFLNVVYGHSINDTLDKNNLDLDSWGGEMISSYLGKISGWVIRANAISTNSLTHIDRWIKLSKGLLLIVEDTHVARASFKLKRFFKLLSNFEGRLDGENQEIRLESIARNREIIADLRNEMITQKKNYCPKLQEYVTKLEVDLADANKL
jgi:hypothetical protein